MNTEEEHESEYTIYEYFPQNTQTGEEYTVEEIISDNDDDFSLNDGFEVGSYLDEDDEIT